MDRISDSGSDDMGSNPVGVTKKRVSCIMKLSFIYHTIRFEPLLKDSNTTPNSSGCYRFLIKRIYRVPLNEYYFSELPFSKVPIKIL
jgi:hypothetical protein